MGLREGMTASEALQHYAILSIGDGLVSQLPSFIIATASAVIITKTSSTEGLGTDLSGQLLNQPNAVAFTSGILAMFSIVPGLPKMPFIILALFLGCWPSSSRGRANKHWHMKNWRKKRQKQRRNHARKKALKNCCTLTVWASRLVTNWYPWLTRKKMAVFWTGSTCFAGRWHGI